MEVIGQKTYRTYEGTKTFLKGSKPGLFGQFPCSWIPIRTYIPNSDPDPGHLNECGFGSTTLIQRRPILLLSSPKAPNVLNHALPRFIRAKFKKILDMFYPKHEVTK
jgi:hypothetical protein